MATYDFDAKKYKQVSRYQKEHGSILIDQLTLRGDENAIDLGCGDGVLTAHLADRLKFGSVLGIDASPSMIRQAQEQARPGLLFCLMNMAEMDYHREFDLVVSSSALNWVKNHGKLLKKIRRSLKPDAVMRLGFAGEGNAPTLTAVLAQTMKAAPFAAGFEGFEWPWFMPSVNLYNGLLEEAGLEDTQVWIEPVNHRFTDGAEMTGWLDQPCLAPFVAQLGGELGQAFRQAVVDKMLDRTRQPDGSFMERFRRINVLARKREHQDYGIGAWSSSSRHGSKERAAGAFGSGGVLQRTAQ